MFCQMKPMHPTLASRAYSKHREYPRLRFEARYQTHSALPSQTPPTLNSPYNKHRAARTCTPPA